MLSQRGTGVSYWHFGGARPWLDRGNGFDWWGFATLAGPGQWDWFMGVRDTGWNGAMALIYGDSSWGRATRSGRWDWFVGARHGGATLAGYGRWDWVMGACHGGARLDRGDGIDLWGRAMGARHWLDPGDGIDLCGRAMGVRDTGWIGAMGLIHGDVPNGKVI